MKQSVKILYEDSDVLAVNKPSGLLVHPASPRASQGGGRGKSEEEPGEETLCDMLLQKYPEIEGVGEPLTLASGEEVKRPGIVHRLDRETSGVMLVARTARAYKFLKRQFQAHEVQKEYRTFAWGKFSPSHGKIDLSLGRSKKDFRQYTNPERARGEMREALTYYETLEIGEEEEKVGKIISYMKVVPKTGRTHQIRAHFKSVGHPIVCDRLYGKAQGTALGFDRVALHSYRVVFRSPEKGEQEAVAPLPKDFEMAIKTFGN